ncbi:MAG TPA: hypothetical protein VID68_08700, partial [Solirubrobacteraceae bacterium]
MSSKRASMREGPLAALFRKTEQDARGGEEASEAPEARPGPPPPDTATRPAADERESAAAEAPNEGAAAAEGSEHQEAEEPRERAPAAPAGPAPERTSGVPTPQERLRAAFSSELPDDMLARRAAAPADVYARAEYGEPRVSAPVGRPRLRVVGV